MSEPRSIPSEFLVLSAALYRELPSERKWTASRRERWLHAVASAVDLHYEVTDERVEPSKGEVDG